MSTAPSATNSEEMSPRKDGWVQTMTEQQTIIEKLTAMAELITIQTRVDEKRINEQAYMEKKLYFLKSISIFLEKLKNDVDVSYGIIATMPTKRWEKPRD